MMGRHIYRRGFDVLQKYKDWITEHYPTKESARLQCEQATLEMQAAFPELQRVRGNVLIGLSYRPHWWLVDYDQNEFIDPTAHQWDTEAVDYDALPEYAEEPLGKCINCGELSYKSRGGQAYFCESCIPPSAYHKRIPE